MVYVSSQVLSQAPRAAVLQAQSDLAKAQQELASGKQADVGLSLGGQSAQLLSIAGQSTRLQGPIDTNALATTRLKSSTAVLDSLQSAASSFLAAVATSNPSSPSISSLAQAAKSNLGSLVSALNTSMGGQFLFAGINTDTAPLANYDASPPSAAKVAVDNSFTSTFGFSPNSPAAASISAADMQSYLDTQFAALFTPSAYAATWSSASDQLITTQVSDSDTATTSVSANEAAFRKLAQAYTMVTEFSGQGLSAAAAQVVATTASNLVSAAGNGLINLNAGLGVSLSAVSDADDRMAAQKSLLDTQAASLQGVDTYALTTRLTSLQTQIQASYELTSQLKSLSLVNYLT